MQKADKTLKGLTEKEFMILGIYFQSMLWQTLITQVRKLGFYTGQMVTSCNTSSDLA